MLPRGFPRAWYYTEHPDDVRVDPQTKGLLLLHNNDLKGATAEAEDLRSLGEQKGEAIALHAP